MHDIIEQLEHKREAARQGRFADARQVMVLFQAAVVARGHGAIGAAAGKLAAAPAAAA